MSTSRPFLSSLAITLAAITFMSAAPASADPPSRVARLGYASGAVSFSPAGESDWVQASINRPLTSGDRLWVDVDARAEIQVGGAQVRLDGGSGVSIVQIDERITQLELTQGVMLVRVRRLDPGQVFEIDTPNLAFTLRKPGEFRIDVDRDGEATTIVVRRGEGEVVGGSESYLVDARQPYRFAGNDLRDIYDVDVPRLDAFDRWASERDRYYDRSVSARYVSDDVVGYQDLDAHGTWRRDADLRQRLVPDARGRRLGAVSRWSLGLGGSLGLDLGGRRALGLRRHALRPVGERERSVGMDPGSGPEPRGLRAGARGLRGRRQLPALDRRRQRRRDRLVPARSARSLPSVVHGEPRLLRERQSQQHGRQHHRDQQHLQQHEHHQRRLRQPAGARRDRRGADDHLRPVASGARERGPRLARDGGLGADGGVRAGRAHADERARRRGSGQQAARAYVLASRRRTHRAAARPGQLRGPAAAIEREPRQAARNGSASRAAAGGGRDDSRGRGGAGNARCASDRASAVARAGRESRHGCRRSRASARRRRRRSKASAKRRAAEAGERPRRRSTASAQAASPPTPVGIAAGRAIAADRRSPGGDGRRRRPWQTRRPSGATRRAAHRASPSPATPPGSNRQRDAADRRSPGAVVMPPPAARVPTAPAAAAPSDAPQRAAAPGSKPEAATATANAAERKGRTRGTRRRRTRHAAARGAGAAARSDVDALRTAGQVDRARREGSRRRGGAAEEGP